MLRAILNKSWRQHPTRYQLYGHLPPIMKTIQARQTRHAGHYWRSKDELIRDELLWTPHMAKQKQDDQLEHTYSSYVRIWDVALKTRQRQWMIGRSGERGSGISVQMAGHNDDDCTPIGITVRVFANDLRDLGSIPGLVIPKTKKMVLDAVSLNTQHYKVWIKGKVEQSLERSSTLEKEALVSPSTIVANLTFTCIDLYMWSYRFVYTNQYDDSLFL